jgi:GDP-L-fucose synthase
MSLIHKNDKIFVAGHRGLAGSAITSELQNKGYTNLLLRSRQELDLENSSAVETFFGSEKPDVVILAAAKVGGIKANNDFRAEFLFHNLQIQNNVIWNAHKHDTRRLVFLGSSCIYPRHAPQPIPASSLMSSPLEITNRSYAVAKIAGMELIDALRRQFGRDYFSVMPTNLYGPGDTFDLEHANVLPAVLRRFYEAKKSGAKQVEVWGSGNPKREFLFSADCASAIVFLTEQLSTELLENSPAGQANWSHVNIGSGQEVSIKELAQTIAEVVGFNGNLVFDDSKPDGTPRKLLDSSYLNNLGWHAKTELRQGIEKTFAWFQENGDKPTTSNA